MNINKDNIWGEEPNSCAKVLKGGDKILYFSDTGWEGGVHLRIKFSRSQMEVKKTHNVPVLIRHVISGKQ